jgi:dihydroceramidase
MRGTLTILGLLVAGALSLNSLPNVWAGWAPDGCRQARCYCEPIREGFVAQFAGTYSNLGFGLVGVLIMRVARRPHERVYGGAVLAVGAGSFFYHTSLTRVGEWFDLVGMYVLTGLLLLFNLERLRPMPGWAFALALSLIAAAGGVQMVVARELQQVFFALLAVSALVLEILVQRRRPLRRDRRYLAGALACFGLGALMWIGDGSVLPCWPSLPFSWHAAWHLLAASSTGLMYLYYRSEA